MVLFVLFRTWHTWSLWTVFLWKKSYILKVVCSKRGKKYHEFKTEWGWLNNDIIVIFFGGWNVPLTQNSGRGQHNSWKTNKHNRELKLEIKGKKTCNCWPHPHIGLGSGKVLRHSHRYQFHSEFPQTLQDRWDGHGSVSLTAPWKR